MAIKLTDYNLVLSFGDKELSLKRVVRKDLSSFLTKYEELLEELIRNNFAIGEYLVPDKNYNKLKALLALIPVEGRTENLKLEELEEEHDLLLTLLIASNWDSEEKEVTGNSIEKPYIAKFLSFDFGTRLEDSAVKVNTEKQKKMESLLQNRDTLLETQKNLPI